MSNLFTERVHYYSLKELLLLQNLLKEPFFMEATSFQLIRFELVCFTRESVIRQTNHGVPKRITFGKVVFGSFCSNGFDNVRTL